MKKNIIFVAITLLILVSLGIGLSYSMWNMSLSQDTNNVIATTSECFDVTLTNESNAIKLENAYPISDKKGKTLTPFTFTIKNVCNTAASYSVSLESLKESTLSSKFLKVMVNDNNPIILGSLDTTDIINSGSIESRILDTGIIFKDQTKDYSIRLWIDYDTTMEDLDNEIKTLKSKIIIKATSLGYTGESVFDFDYTGSEQIFTAPVTGTYKLETWGASGGNVNEYHGGYGGYATGLIKLNKDVNVNIVVGGVGSNATEAGEDLTGGYNGGGSVTGNIEWNHINASGGGATHIATKTGLLSSLENYKDSILIVSGGGGGAKDQPNHEAVARWGIGGSGGGFKGGSPLVYVDLELTKMNKFTSDQNSGSAFGQAASSYGNAAGGGGFYGGYYGNEHSGYYTGAATGGSGYIENSLLTEKIMYCYDCEESSEVSTKTVSTTCSEETPTENCAKKGNGYARITLISIDE